MVCGRHIIFMSNKKAWQKINQKKQSTAKVMTNLNLYVTHYKMYNIFKQFFFGKKTEVIRINNFN
jgi:hypothetical protein